MEDIHVYPVNDKYEHTLEGKDCMCVPRVELEGATLIIIHNSYDGREVIEEARGIIEMEMNNG